MKKNIIALIVILGLWVGSSNAKDAPVTDTLLYLQSIVNNKANYIGQPYSKLLDSLQIQVKYFWPNRSVIHDTTKEPSTHFSFHFPQSPDEIYLTYPCLEVFWQTPMNALQSDILWVNNNGGGWSPTVRSFYSSAIVLDIKVRE